MNKDRLLALTAIILAAACARILPHPANATPLAAIALFSGAKFENKLLAFAVPFAALLLSDMIIGFYPEMLVTYAAFAAVVCIGFLLKGRESGLSVLGASLTASIWFFAFTNFPLWAHYDLYSKDAAGIAESYTMALPFFRNTLLGDLFFTGLIFGGYAMAQRRWRWLK